MNKNKEVTLLHQSKFESIRKDNQEGRDNWSARDMQTILDYSKWDKFLLVIEKAKQACVNSGQKDNDHFLQVGKMVDIGSGAQREIDDIWLSRYACYLIVQNADPSKPIVALGQTYFAVQTRKQELIEQTDYQNLNTEEEKRIFLRNQLKVHNKQLAGDKIYNDPKFFQKWIIESGKDRDEKNDIITSISEPYCDYQYSD